MWMETNLFMWNNWFMPQHVNMVARQEREKGKGRLHFIALPFSWGGDACLYVLCETTRTLDSVNIEIKCFYLKERKTCNWPLEETLNIVMKTAHFMSIFSEGWPDHLLMICCWLFNENIMTGRRAGNEPTQYAWPVFGDQNPSECVLGLCECPTQSVVSKSLVL